MPQPNVGAFHIDAALTNISVALLQSPGSFIASRIFQNVPVQKQSDKFFTFDRSYFNRNGAKKRAAGARVSEVGYEVSNDSYFCEEYGVAIPIPDQVRANADPAADPARAAAELATHQMLIQKEVDFSSSFFSTGIWSKDITGVASSPSTDQVIRWSDTTNGDPIGNVRTGIDFILGSTGIKPNVMAMGRPVYSALIDHPDIQGRINGGATTSQPSIASLNLLAQIFEVDEVMVGEAIQNTAAEGDTAAHSFILGKKCLLTYRPPSPGIMTPAAGYTFSWAGYLGGTNEFGFVVDTKRRDEEDTDVVRARSHYDHKVVSSSLGYFWDAIVA
jgi:hypothetical protein